ncbi:MAG: porin, partial [Sodaliphilus sp.]|nr:porin [Sodaliphilus sp.]
KIFGGNYKYDMHDAVLGGMKDKSLEVVGRVSITNLNDIASGEHYSAESGKYFPDGYDESKPYESASVGGGRIISATLGVNYAFNKYAQVMLHYTYSNLDKDALPGDSNFHQVQARVQFTF